MVESDNLYASKRVVDGAFCDCYQTVEMSHENGTREMVVIESCSGTARMEDQKTCS